MIKANKFAERQLELNAEFGKYIFGHPELDDLLQDSPHVYFQIAGDREFNAYSRRLANQTRTQGSPVLMVHIDGLTPTQESRFVNPVFQANAARRKPPKKAKKRTVAR